MVTLGVGSPRRGELEVGACDSGVSSKVGEGATLELGSPRAGELEAEVFAKAVAASFTVTEGLVANGGVA